MEAMRVTPIMAEMSSWLYIGACVALPLAWGVATEFIFRWLSRRREARHAEEMNAFIDYQI